MTFPSRVVALQRITEPQAQSEAHWRAVCVTFLEACFNGAPRARLWQLGDEVYRARVNLQSSERK